MKLKLKLLTATTLGMFSLAITTNSFAATNEELAQKIAALEDQLNLLKRQLEVKDEVAKAKAEKTANVEFGKKGLAVTSPDKNYSLKVRGYAQFDAHNFLDDKNGTGKDELVSRRIRPVIEGTVAKDFSFRFMPDFGGSTTRVFDAYIEYKFNEAIGVRVGKYKPPVGLERLQSATDISFIERGLPTNLAPNRDYGAQLQGLLFDGVVEYQLGIFNGNEDLGNADSDADDKKDLAARIFVTPFAKSDHLALQNLGIGVGSIVGDREGRTGAAILPTYRSPGQASVFTYTGGSGGAALAAGSNTRVYPQAYYYYNSFGILAEYAISKQEVSNAAGTLKETLSHKAWQTVLSYVLTGEDAGFRGVKPSADFDPHNGTWGAFEIVGRYGSLDIDNKTFPIYANLNSSVTQEDSFGLGLNWYMNENIKVALNYDVTQFQNGAAAGVDRADENALFSRLQIKF